MKTTTLFIATAFALGALAGCHRNDSAPKQPTSSAPSTSTPAPSSTAGTGSSATPQSNTPSTPANLGTPSQSEKQPPVQGREDVRQPEQQKDFKHQGDGAGPKSGG